MQTFFQDYLKLLEERHAEILEALDGLPLQGGFHARARTYPYAIIIFIDWAFKSI
jgi:hypothetical protein